MDENLSSKQDGGWTVEFNIEKSDFASSFRKSSETRCRVLSRVSLEVLNIPRSKTKLHSHMEELKKIEYSYKNAMETFLYQFEKFLNTVQEHGQVLKKSTIEFHNASRMTAQVTLLSAGKEIAFILAHCVHKLFDFRWNPSISRISTLIGAASATASLFALSYMKHSTEKVSRHVRNIYWIISDIKDLILLLGKGSWIDEAVLNLFPHGISSKLITDDDLEERSIFKDKMAWKQFLCSVILMTNVRKDEKLLNNGMFLEKVKLFVESRTAEIWWHRIKLRKSLDGLKLFWHEFSRRNKFHYKQNDLLRYYCFLLNAPWLLDPKPISRIVCGTSGAFLALNELRWNDCVECEKLVKLFPKFEKDIQEITEIYKALVRVSVGN